MSISSIIRQAVKVYARDWLQRAPDAGRLNTRSANKGGVFSQHCFYMLGRLFAAHTLADITPPGALESQCSRRHSNSGRGDASTSDRLETGSFVLRTHPTNKYIRYQLHRHVPEGRCQSP